MGNKNTKPATTADKTKKDVPVHKEAFDKLDDINLNYYELDVALEHAKSADGKENPDGIQNPYIIIISAKHGGAGTNSDIFDEKDSDNAMLSQILQKGNHSIIHQKTHKEIKLQLQDITKKISAEFDGTVVILLCIVQLHDIEDDDGNSEEKQPQSEQTLKFYYDIDKEKRHVEKLRKDIIYRLDEGQQSIYVHYDETTVIARIDNGKPRPSPKNAHFAKKIAGIRSQKQKEKDQRNPIKKDQRNKPKIKE